MAVNPYDQQRNGGIAGGAIDPRYGLVHTAMNLRRTVRSAPGAIPEPYRQSVERRLRKLLETSNVTEAEIDVHEADVEANGSPLFTVKR